MITNYTTGAPETICRGKTLRSVRTLVTESKSWRMRVSIPLPRRCERRTLPIELIPQTRDLTIGTRLGDWKSQPSGRKTVSYDKIGTIQRRLAWPLRKDDTHKSRTYHFLFDSDTTTKKKNEKQNGFNTTLFPGGPPPQY